MFFSLLFFFFFILSLISYRRWWHRRYKSVQNQNQNQNQSALKKQVRHDQMSQLPEDVLILLVSQLSMKEATASGVLSRQWLNVWKFATRLDFDASSELNVLEEKSFLKPSSRKFRKLLDVERVKYVNWVNELLRLHKGAIVDKFKIRFDLDCSNSRDIDNWLRFAFARKVKSIEVNLLKYNRIPHVSKTSYNFPSQLIFGKKDFQRPHPNLGVDHNNSFPGFKSLKSLSFTCVNVSDEVLGFFLSSCPCLERLEVDNSGTLRNIEVSGHSLMLKHLKISECSNLTSVKVCNTNLVSLDVLGFGILVYIENLPLLVEVSLGFIIKIEDIFTTLSSCLSELKVLTLRIGTQPQLKNIELHEYPVLRRLKSLKIISLANENESLMGYTALIRATPYLADFMLELIWVKGSRMLIKSNKTPSCSNELKVVKLTGYRGSAPDLEVVMFFVQNALALEELIIDTNDPLDPNQRCWSDSKIKAKDEAEIRAIKQLEGKVPSRVKLLIL